MLKYIIYADEAWTHSQPLYRYHCFFGGFLSTNDEFLILENRIKILKKTYKYHKEIKWNNISKRDIDFYNQVLNEVDIFLRKSDHTKYRQFFMDRSRVYTGIPSTLLETQFKVYYQFLKHSFGFQYIEQPTEILIRLDSHSSHTHKANIISFIRELSFQNIHINIEFIDSRKSIPLQLCDLLMGAAGYYGNKVDWDLLPNKKRRSPNQMMKHLFGKKVFNLFRNINQHYRHAQAFNWFETTGNDGDPKNRFHHKLRIWKFEPRECILDKRWENDAFKNNQVRKLPS